MELETKEGGSNCKSESESEMKKWRSESNWGIANGSLHNSITIESSDCPITHPDQAPPLLLKPLGSDSGPCEIKICLGEKYEICQIYVRSSARVYEVYYAQSPQSSSSSEYLCTVRCGVAERDDKLLEPTFFEDVVMDGGNVVSTDDDWVKIKAPDVERDENNNASRGVVNVQALYEATAQISDAEPCSHLTIRLLSLQDKGHVYIDEVYVFVDPVESTDSGTEVPAGNSAQSSLIAMFMPTLMQLSKSGASRIKDNHAPTEMQEDNNIENELRRVDGGLEKNLFDTHNVKELDKDTDESNEIPKPISAPNSKNCAQSVETNDLPSGCLERALEQLISRVSRVEDICLRFEEKLLKPIQNMEARFQQVERQLETRLQNVENQLEKLTTNFPYSGLPHCTKISATSFSCSEFNSSTLNNEGPDCTSSRAPKTEKKDLSCDIIPDSYDDPNIRPSLVIRAPEFSYNEDEENKDDLKASEDSPCTEPKQSLSIDDALAAALSGFLSTAKTQHSENFRLNSGLSSEADEENQHVEFAESCHMKPEELDSENCKSQSLRYTQVLAVTAPDFTVEEIGDENPVNCTETSSDTAAVFINEEKDYDDEKVTSIIEIKDIFTSADSSNVNVNESVDEFVSASNDANANESVNEFVSTSDDTSSVVGTCLGIEHLNEISPNISESSHTSSLDFNFPILEVNFTSDVHITTKSPLEALLDGEADSQVEASIHDTRGDDDDNTEQMNAVIGESNGTSDLLPGDHPLLDIEFSAADGSSNLEKEFHNPCTPSSLEMIASLI